ncbi:AAA family ATPase [Thermodesulfobacteriota bacterium]
MAFIIALSGKGGTGKTTVSGLLMKSLLKNNLGPVLGVDADANSNLNEVLAIEVEETIGAIREEMSSVPEGMTKDAYIEYRVQEALMESDGFDLVVMGRPEGSGCYCFANTLTKKYVDMLADNYKSVIIDNEAGMEHMSRRTTHDPDILLIVSNPNMRGILTASRINELSTELKLKSKKVVLIVNKVPEGGLDKRLYEEIETFGLELAAEVPANAEIEENELSKTSILNIADDNPAFVAIDNFVKSYVTPK